MTERTLIGKLQDLEVELAANNVIIEGHDEGAYAIVTEAMTEIAAMADAIDRLSKANDELQRALVRSQKDGLICAARIAELEAARG